MKKKNCKHAFDQENRLKNVVYYGSYFKGKIIKKIYILFKRKDMQSDLYKDM